MKDRPDSLEHLRLQLSEFARVRDWEQFHSPKNLSMALIAEAAELVEHFQWLTEQESCELSDEKLEQVSQELADILIYTIRTADRLGVDLIASAQHKIQINEARYPVSEVRGDARRASEYQHNK